VQRVRHTFRVNYGGPGQVFELLDRFRHCGKDAQLVAFLDRQTQDREEWQPKALYCKQEIEWFAVCISRHCALLQDDERPFPE
jgi:hypothetical protein